MENKSQNVLDFCSKWGVNVKTIPYDEFIIKRDAGILDAVIPQVNEKILLSEKYADSLRGLKCFKKKIDDKHVEFDNIIYFSNKFIGNYNSLILHELCHILLKVKPKLIDEFNSPLTALWYRFIKLNNIEVQFLNKENHDELLFNVLKSRKSIQLNWGLKDYFNFQNDFLIKNKLLDKDLNPTFDNSSVNPTEDWLC